MKKCLLILLLCACFIFAGCSDIATVGLIQNANGSVDEFYYIPYAEEELLAAGLTIKESEEIKTLAQSRLDLTFAEYINAYKKRIEASEKYTEEEKEVLKNGVTCKNSFSVPDSSHIQIGPDGVTLVNIISRIQYELHFENKTCYLEFKNAIELLSEKKETVEEKYFLTTISKVIKDPVFDKMVNESLTLGQSMADVFEETIVQVMAGTNATQQDLLNAQERWNTIKESVGYNTAKEKYSYIYVVPTARLHSNADEIIMQDGYYYHIWEISANNSNLPDTERVQFEYWTVSANRPVWYALILLGAGVVILITWIKSKKQEKKELNDIKNQITIGEENLYKKD